MVQHLENQRDRQRGDARDVRPGRARRFRGREQRLEAGGDPLLLPATVICDALLQDSVNTGGRHGRSEVEEPMIDATHDAKRRSFVESANGHPDFPIQNLPFGIYSKRGERPRGGIAIGDEIRLAVGVHEGEGGPGHGDVGEILVGPLGEVLDDIGEELELFDKVRVFGGVDLGKLDLQEREFLVHARENLRRDLPRPAADEFGDLTHAVDLGRKPAV